jgi:hypothetical protein
MIRCLLALLLFLPAASTVAQNIVFPEVDISSRYIARIELHTVDELMNSLLRAEKLQREGSFIVGRDAPIAFVLHGPEAKALFLNNYAENKSLVDLAARLSAFDVVDIKVCETWSGSQGLDVSRLPPFIGTIPYGPAEEKRLLEQEKYVYF